MSCKHEKLVYVPFNNIVTCCGCGGDWFQIMVVNDIESKKCEEKCLCACHCNPQNLCLCNGVNCVCKPEGKCGEWSKDIPLGCRIQFELLIRSTFGKNEINDMFHKMKAEEKEFRTAILDWLWCLCSGSGENADGRKGIESLQKKFLFQWAE